MDSEFVDASFSLSTHRPRGPRFAWIPRRFSRASRAPSRAPDQQLGRGAPSSASLGKCLWGARHSHKGDFVAPPTLWLPFQTRAHEPPLGPVHGIEAMSQVPLRGFRRARRPCAVQQRWCPRPWAHVIAGPRERPLSRRLCWWWSAHWRRWAAAAAAVTVSVQGYF